MMNYEFIKMVEFDIENSTRVTKMWRVLNKRAGDQLGVVKWHAPWRQYCYFPTVQAVYSAGCLRDITHFINEQMSLRKRQPTTAVTA